MLVLAIESEMEKVSVVHVLWSILQSGTEVLSVTIQYSGKWGCITEMSCL